MADGPADTTTTATTTEAPAQDAAAADAAQPGTDAPSEDGTVLGGDPGEGATGGDDGDAGDKYASDKTDAAETPARVAPDKYELKAPEGMTFDAEAFEAAEPVFRDLGLSNEEAQKLMPVAGEFAQRAGAAAVAKHELDKATAFTAMRREWLENAKGDAEIGGAKWDQSTAAAAKALDMLGFTKGSDFRTYLDETGLGNHPEMIRAFSRVGLRVSEDTFERGGTTEATTPKTDREMFYPDFKQAVKER